MEDQRFPFQDDFEKRLATLRLRADELVGQAVALRGFVELWLGENVSGSYRKELEMGLLEDPGSHPEPARRIRGFSRVAEDLTRSLSELDGQADTLAGQERQLASAHGALKELTEEINALTLAVEDTLQGKNATLSRVTGLTKEISARTQNLKRRQESLSGAIQEAVRTVESKDQELLAVLEQMKPGVFFGDRHLEQLKELLTTQEELICLARDLGRSPSPETGNSENRDGVYKRAPAYLQNLSEAAQETAQDLSRMHQGLRSLNSGPGGEPWDQVIATIAPCRRTLEELKKNLKTQEETVGSVGPRSAGDSEADGPWDSLYSLNEKITLLALRASLNTFHKGKKPEDLIKVMEEIRGLSAQVNQILLPLAEGRKSPVVPPPTEVADQSIEAAKNPPWESSLEKWSTLLTALESALPAIDRLKGVVAEQHGFGEKLLEDLTRILTQCQGLMFLFRDQAWATSPFPQPSSGNPQTARRLQKMAEFQGIQLQELNQNLQHAWSQVRPLRRVFQGAGLGGFRALSSQLEEMREFIDSQGHELLIQGAKGEQLVKEMEGLRAFWENLERLLPTQGRRQVLLQEAAGKIDGTAKRMNQSLEEQKRLVDGLAGQARQVYQQYGPLVQAHQKQSSLAATLLEAFTELHQQIVRQLPRK
jgi:ABC-type transporter Mla subunit MlaD